MRFTYMDVGEGREQDAEASLIAPHGYGNVIARSATTRQSRLLRYTRNDRISSFCK
jgi:hypothetical protein